jgi:hypothetical protein
MQHPLGSDTVSFDARPQTCRRNVSLPSSRQLVCGFAYSSAPKIGVVGGVTTQKMSLALNSGLQEHFLTPPTTHRITVLAGPVCDVGMFPEVGHSSELVPRRHDHGIPRAPSGG